MQGNPVSSASIIPTLAREEYERRQRRAQSGCSDIWTILDAVMDPEIPVISIYELGVLQDVDYDGERVTVVLTPTYSGCPALNVMEEDAREALSQAGYNNVDVSIRLAPAWTTTWLTPEARKKMANYGVAAPNGDAPTCPQCASEQVSVISEFGSTACKALYKCHACGEPFDLFKTI